MNIHKPKSIKEAINDLHVFFDSDLYSKFRPEHKLPTGKKKIFKSWYRQDVFPNENEFRIYLDGHFEILRKEITKLIGKKKFEGDGK